MVLRVGWCRALRVSPQRWKVSFRRRPEILDYGCGTGDIAAALATGGYRVVGRDVSAQHDRARRVRFMGRPARRFPSSSLVVTPVDAGCDERI